MRKFIVNVNGSSYEVEVEEVSSANAAAAKPASAPAAPAAPAPAPAPAAKPTGGEKTITSPMPGDTFRSGQVLVVLEAMKMENEIMAPADGKVVSVNVNKGASVNSGEILIAYV